MSNEHNNGQQKASQQDHGPRSRAQERGYLTFMGVYGAVTSALVAVGFARRERISTPGPVDVALLGLATHKLSRLISKDLVTTPLRAPLTEIEGSGAPSELNERPVGQGWTYAIGELISCPFCLDMWVATGLTAATVLAPKLGRTVAAGLASVAVADFLQYAYSVADQSVE